MNKLAPFGHTVMSLDADISDQLPQLYIMFWRRNSMHRPNNYLCVIVYTV